MGDGLSHTDSGKLVPQADRLRLVAERRCSSGQLHFEKTTGHELIRGNPSRLFSDRDGGIIDDCAGRCESDSRCMGFNMDYNRNECQSVTTNSENNLFNLRPASGTSYFEGICLKGMMILIIIIGFVITETIHPKWCRISRFSISKTRRLTSLLMIGHMNL